MAQAVLAYYGFDVCEDVIIKMAGTDKKKGTPIKGVVRVLRHFGLAVESGQLSVDDVKARIDKKQPVILVLQAWSDTADIDWVNNWTDGHYVVATGYDDKRIYFANPWTLYRTYLTYEEWAKRWHNEDNDGKRYVNLGILAAGTGLLLSRIVRFPWASAI